MELGFFHTIVRDDKTQAVPVFCLMNDSAVLNKIRKCKARRERFTPYQSKDPSPTIPTYIKNAKGKTVEDKEGANILGQ